MTSLNVSNAIHSSRHSAGGPDEITPADIGADVAGAAATAQANAAADATDKVAGVTVASLGAITPAGVDTKIADERVTERANQMNTYVSWHNVKSYGAAGNDLDNDGPDIQAAIDACAAAGGGTVYLPTGTYRFATGLTLPGTVPVNLVGESRTSTVLRYSGTGVAITIDGTATDPNDWGSISKLEVWCTAAAATTAVKIVHVHRGYIEDVYLRGNSYSAGSRGLWATSAWGNYVYQSVIAGFDTGIDADPLCNDFTIHDVNIGAQTACVRMKDSSDFRIHGGQHSGTGTVTVGHMIVSTTECPGLEILEVHYEGNGLDLALGRVADGSTQSISNALIGVNRFPSGLTIDRAFHPVLLATNVGDGLVARVFTLTANCTYPVIVGLKLAGLTTLSDASGTPTVISDVNGRTGIGTLVPSDRLHVAGGDFLMDNNRVIRFKDSGGMSRRLFLLTGGNTFMVGDIDNAMAAAPVIIASGGTGTIQMNVGGANALLLNSGSVQAQAGDIQINAVSKGLKVKEGVNGRTGVVTLVAGTVTVANATITANSRIQLTAQSLGTVTAPKTLAVTARVNGTSFTITSADATDTSVVAYFISEGF